MKIRSTRIIIITGIVAVMLVGLCIFCTTLVNEYEERLEDKQRLCDEYRRNISAAESRISELESTLERINCGEKEKAANPDGRE